MQLRLLERIFDRTRTLKIMVIGDYFLDNYLVIDEQKDEASVETGKTAYQVTQSRANPGAAGSVVSNLHALGVGEILAVGIIGSDGYGYQLKKLLQAKGININSLFSTAERLTPTYIKPIRQNEELNRLDLKNWSPTPSNLEERIINVLKQQGPECDAIIVADQVSEAECGVITSKVREVLQNIGEKHPELIILVDSRKHIAEFKKVIIKPNEFEAGLALGLKQGSAVTVPGESAIILSKRTGKPVFLTCGKNGQWVASGGQATHIPAINVDGPIDIVGAGDSTAAGITIALATGVTSEEAALFGNLVASVTITKLGMTGTATPEEVVVALAKV